LSEETIKQVLNEFGLTEREAEVYIFLAKHGVQKGGEISKQTKIPKALIYHILKDLERKGVAESTLEFPARFTAVPFEAVLELNIKAKRDEAALIEKRKSSLLEDWRNISKTVLEPELAKFVVIEGTRKIYRKIAEIVEKTQNSLSAVSTVSDLVRAEQFGVIDSINVHPMKSKINFRFLTEVSKQNLKAISLLRTELNAGLNIKARNPDLGLALFPRMVIRDDEEILFFISSSTQQPTRKRDACIFTNCGSLVQAFAGVFEDLWRNATSIEEKIVEIETGKPTPKTLILSDAETAKEKYNQTLRAAEEEIIMITSEKDLIQLSEGTLPLKELSKRDISVRIMAPITIENMEQAKLLSEYCEIRHVASSYLGTTIVDGKQLFQLKASLSDQGGPGNEFSFKNAFYTADLAYIEKMKNMLEDVWKRAYDPSKATMPPLMRLYASSKNGLDTKRDLKKLPKRLLSAAKAHGQIASGIGGEIIIEPPNYLNMPTLRISPNHFEHAHSKRGADLLRIDLWLKTPQGEGFVPVAIVTDAPPEIFDLSKAQFAGTLAGENHISVKPEEIQVWNKGKTLFAGWTIPIPLLASKYVLDPACIIFEAYGDEIHSTHSYPLPSGYLMGLEWDGFQAFTTYIGPSWKYSGPGIYGSVGNFLLIVAKPETTNTRTA
jgi:sugar-specific transcriptional regulator TrmB